MDKAGLVTLFETMLQDLRYGARMLHRNAGFTAIAVIALALGIGVNTAVFTVYKAVIHRSLDARNPAEMVNIALTRDSGATNLNFSYPDYQAYRDSAHSFNGLIAFSPEHMRLSDAGDIADRPTSRAGKAEFAFVFVVSENYFKVLGVAPIRGRTFESVDSSALMASPSVLISENYWQKRFARDPAVLGKSIRLNNATLTIVGITPHDFVGTSVASPDFWLPIVLEPLVHANSKWLRDRENQRYRLFGRLAAGRSISQARAEMTNLANHVRTTHEPHSDQAKSATTLVWPGSPFPRPLKAYPGLHLAVLLIMAVAGMVLAVACANVASLQLARARSRQNELHTRLSLGASRFRVIRQLLTESALLGLLAGATALPSTSALLKVSWTLAVEALPADAGTFVLDVAPDLQIFVYVFAISLVAGILFGLAPAIESSRSALSSSSRSGTSPLSTRRIQNFLIAAQVSLSLVLMIAGSMFVHGAIQSIKMDTGYDSKRIIDLDLQFPEGPKYSPNHKLALVRELRTRLAALPGVAAVTSAQPPDDNTYRTAVLSVHGEKSSGQNLQLILYYTYVQSNYFGTLAIPLILGRGFQPQAGESEHSVILSESAARQLWPGKNPIGLSIRLGAIDEGFHERADLFAAGPTYQVIGVVRDKRGVEFDGSDSRQVYLPLPENRMENYPILVRTQSDPGQVMRAIGPMTSSIDPDLVATASTLDQLLRQTASFLTSSLAAAVASTAGLVGLLLASMGIYGTVSYIVVLRTREIGIRMAVGAQKRDILRLILRESTRPVLAGLLVGILLSVGVSYLLRGLLYGLNTVDSISFIGVSILFLTIALLASYPPSRRAMRVDPTVALRYE